MLKALKDIVKEASIKSNNYESVSLKDIVYLIKETFSLDEVSFILNENNLYEEDLVKDKLDLLFLGMPVEYVLGYRYFLGRKFIVTKDTLIPRNETEELVLYTKELIKKENFVNPSIVEVGTGSGCISISLSLDYECCVVHSIDLSSDALVIAKKNNDLLGSDVTFFNGDTLEPVLNNKYDVLTSNPPYIDVDTFVQESVIKYEPHMALFALNHGLEIYEKIFKNVDKVMNKHALLTFEISPDLVPGLTLLKEKYLPSFSIEFKEDMNGLVRFLFLIRR